jgi:hypothetical protein
MAVIPIETARNSASRETGRNSGVVSVAVVMEFF